MKTIVCVTCQSTNIKKNGTTSSGKQRYYCKNCKTSFTHEYDSTFKDFALFLDYVTHTHSQNDYTIAGRTLREKTRRFWQYWPLPPLVNESYDIVFIDGIYITRKIVVLIACTTTHIIGWYVARSQTTAAYTALLSRIAAPTIAVSDGGSGFRKACKNTWPNTKIQRCLFHIYMTIRTATTLHPRLLPGKQLLRIGTSLLKVKTLDHARQWVHMYALWYETWHDWLNEKTLINTRWQDTHACLAKAARSINTLIQQNQLFTNLHNKYYYTYKNQGIVTNNQIEGGANTQLRALLRAHRGMKLNRHIKTIFWYCYTHSTPTQNPQEYLPTMPTHTDTTQLYRHINEYQQWKTTIPGRGNALAYTEFHHDTPRHETY